MNYRVIVGNIGTVYDGESLKDAERAFKEYKEQSRTGYGRASYEEVTMLAGDETKQEFRPRLRTPSIQELASVLSGLKKEIDDDYRAFEDSDVPGMQVTIGCSYDKEWSIQTGDNSYTGGAYGHPFWGVAGLYRDSNCREVAKELIEDALQQAW